MVSHNLYNVLGTCLTSRSFLQMFRVQSYSES